MILTDREIQLAISSKQLTVDPLPSQDAYSSTALDLTLAETGERWKKSPGQIINPSNKEYKYADLESRKEKIQLNNFIFLPQTFILAWTAETISIPNQSRLAARVEGKSSIARLGVGVHVTAPTIHAGFTGQIQLEMWNIGPNEIMLNAGMSICQLIFETTLGTPQKGYAGMFAGQVAKPA